VHRPTQRRHQVVIAHHRLVPRRWLVGVPVAERPGLAVEAVQLSQVGDESDLLRSRLDGQPSIVEPVGRGPRVEVVVLGDPSILEQVSYSCQDSMRPISLAAQRKFGPLAGVPS